MSNVIDKRVMASYAKVEEVKRTSSISSWVVKKDSLTIGPFDDQKDAIFYMIQLNNPELTRGDDAL